jgi:hypothetical protein
MSETICEDNDAERPGTKFRALDLAASAEPCETMACRIRRERKIVKILSYRQDPSVSALVR